jgi:aryl-alcohol dehydrogenase-like predicted oxidoreductase
VPATTTAAGTITIGGDLVVHRLGYGTMRLPGEGVIGPPQDIAAARATLRLLPELGVDVIETSVAYGPLIADLLVREVLHPYRDMVIASSGGMLRPGPSRWTIDGRPEALRRAVETSLRALGVERLDLWQLQRIDPAVPVAEQFGAIADMQREGMIRHVGLCNVGVPELDAAAAHFTVASVQCRYHVIDRTAEPVLERCERDGIPFFAYFPLATGALAAADSVLTRTATKLGITPAQIALAWLLKRSKSIIAIPGTTEPAHLRENVAAASIVLSDEDFAEVSRVGRRAAMLRAPA